MSSLLRLVAAPLAALLAQTAPAPFVPVTHSIVVPHIGVCATDGGPPRLRLVQVVAVVRLEDQRAETSLEVTVENLTDSHEAFELVVPVPKGVQPGGCAGYATAFTQDGTGLASVQEVLATGSMPAPDAAEKKPVTKLTDGAVLFTLEQLATMAHTPWPLEFAAGDLLHTPGFELAPKGQITVHVQYAETLTFDAGLALYTLPRSESHDALVIPFGLDVRVHSGPDHELASAYSPSHWIHVQRQGAHDLRVLFQNGRHPEPGPIQLAVLRATDILSGGVFAKPSDPCDPLPELAQGAPDAAGTFLLHTGFRAKIDQPRTPREITLVIDRPGSMDSGKLEQARDAAWTVLGDLAPDEAFHLISYSSAVDSLSTSARAATPSNLAAARDYLFALNASGGTNIDEALRTALTSRRPSDGRLPLVLFLTDGLPTSGVKSERQIGSNAALYNEHQRRIFTFGVGNDVNAPLLDRLAANSGGTSHYVRPGQNIEEHIADVYQGLRGAILTAPVLEVFDTAGNPRPDAVRHLLPARLPDLYEDDQLIVTGQYLGETPLVFRITGTLGGEQHSFEIPFSPKEHARTDADFVPTLWAGRQLGVMIEAIRQAGALPAGSARDFASEGQRIDAILALSKRFGILGEYTGFLTLSSTDLFDLVQERKLLNTLLRDRAQLVRVGRVAIAQSLNSNAAQTQATLNRLNRFVDGSMNEIQIASVRQVAGRAFFLRGTSWVDSSLCLAGAPLTVDEHLFVGDERYRELLATLATAGRPGLISLPGNILLRDGTRALFIEAPH